MTRSHSALRLLTLLLVALLVVAVAAPAEPPTKRPRRYDATVLMNWTICPAYATLTIGYQGDSAALPDPNPNEATWPSVYVNAELPSSPGSSLIDGGPQTYAIADMPNEPGVLVNQIDDDAGGVVTDGPPLDSEGNPIEGSTATITHRREVEVTWSQPVDVGHRIRLGLGEPGTEPTYGTFEAVFCPPREGGQTEGSSPGVTTGSSLSTEEILDLSEGIDETREAGRGPGGSLVPLSQCTIVGTPGKDRVAGTPGNDVICGLGGNDVVDGAGGLDLIDGANGEDRLRGGSGKDVLLGLRGNDRLNGNSGDDRAGDGAGDDRVSGSSGNDRLGGGSGNDRLNGGKGHDRIRGGSGNDRIGARDRTRDAVDGGSGLDRATVDRLGGARRTAEARRRADRVRGVERLL
jgi:hemolysin type calcium-binding protein